MEARIQKLFSLKTHNPNEAMKTIREAVRNVCERLLQEETEYEKHFADLMSALGVEKVSDLTDEGKAALFNFAGQQWNKSGDTTIEYDEGDMKSHFEIDHFKDASDAPYFLHERKAARDIFEHVQNFRYVDF